MIDLLTELANEINRGCPFMVDSETRFDSAIALADNMFQYNYSLVNIEKSKINVEEVTRIVEPGMINQLGTSPEMKIFRKNRTTVIYYYIDNAGVFALKIIIPYEKYFDRTFKEKLSQEELDERRRRNNVGLSRAFGWMPTGATIGGLIGFCTGISGWSEGGVWNLFFVDAFYGILIGGLTSGIFAFLYGLLIAEIK